MKKKKKSEYVSVVFPTISPRYKNKRYYYKTKRNLTSGEEIRVETANSPSAKAFVAETNTKRPKRRIIKEIK